jgi:hypothetical protein
MLPPNDISAEASQIADVVIRWALELYEYKIPLAEWRPPDPVSLRLVEPRGERRHHLRVPALGVDVAHLDEVDRLDGGGAPELGDLRLDVPAAEAVLEGVGVDLRDERGSGAPAGVVTSFGALAYANVHVSGRTARPARCEIDAWL